MRKIKLWVEIGYAGADYEEIIDVDDDATDEEIWEEADMFLVENISYGWDEVDMFLAETISYGWDEVDE